MKLSLFLFFIFQGYLTFGQSECDTVSFGLYRGIICKEVALRNFDPDSLARAHALIEHRIYQITVPADSSLKPFVFMNLFRSKYGNYIPAVSSIRSSRKRRNLYILQMDTTVSLFNYKNGLKQGPYFNFYAYYALKEKGHYKKGKQCGRWAYWNKNGDLNEVKIFRKDSAIKSFSGRQLKSLRLVRIGAIAHFGVTQMNLIGLNAAIRENDADSSLLNPARIHLNFGFEFGNPSSLTLRLFQHINMGKLDAPISIFTTSYGAKLLYTYYQSKNMNYRFGAGVNSSRVNMQNDYYFYFSNTVLNNKIINYKKAIGLNFCLSFLQRKMSFRKNSNRDLGAFFGMEAGYNLPIISGKYYDEAGNQILQNSSPFYYKGFHVSLFVFPCIL